MSLLEVNGLNTYYGDSHILFDIALHVERNEVVALLGRNGAGKSTTLKSLMGVVLPRAGSIVFDGVEIGGSGVHLVGGVPQVRDQVLDFVHQDRRLVAGHARVGEHGLEVLDVLLAEHLVHVVDEIDGVIR